MTAQSDPSRATPYSYTDPGGPGQDSYTVVPSPRISFPVSQVRFVTADSQKILTLCEVFVFGETKCPAGKFGLRCERQCHCTRQESCFVHSGGCPSGCAIGYTGEDCSECNTGTYGAGPAASTVLDQTTPVTVTLELVLEVVNQDIRHQTVTRSVILGHMELGVQDAVVSTVLVKTTAVTM
ncbi:hypothetical protein RRG08_062537 [Elysia crispata]|uniref:Uncharacterized protein n=1 Tax=Elysia crispata TaxID=231223 RepID=A0AAE0YJJ5_9GAST|nr:hypothetical protein RRG08_062537 [Elysia crispata]